MSFASTDDHSVRKSSICSLKSRTRAIPTPTPARNITVQRPPLSLAKPQGLIVTPSLPAECFSSPMLFIKLEKIDYEADKVDIEFISEQMFSHAIHKDKMQLKDQVKAQEYIVNLQEKQVKYISLQRLPKNSDQAPKPSISFRDALQLINTPALVESKDDISCQVHDQLRQSKIEVIESHQMKRIKASEHPNVFRNQYLIRILNNKPPQDDKSANVAYRNRFKTRKTVKKQVSKRTSENQQTVFKLIQDKIREFKELIKQKRQTEHMNYQHHCVDLNLQSIHQQNKQNQTRADERGPQHTLKEFLNLGLDNLTNVCIRPEMDVLKRKRSDVQSNNYEDSYTRYNDWKTKTIKEHINQFITVQNKCTNIKDDDDNNMNNMSISNNNNSINTNTDTNLNQNNTGILHNPNNEDGNSCTFDESQSYNLTPKNSTCNDIKCDKSKNEPKPLGRTSSNNHEYNPNMEDDTLYLDPSKTMDQVQELYQLYNGASIEHVRPKGYKENFKRDHGRVDMETTRK